jgi:hypothetical protein
VAQIRKGTVAVTNASTSVYHVWTAIFTSIASGPFVDGEALSWGADGIGIAVRYDAVAKTLTFIRATGDAPAIGDTVTGAGGASGVIVEQGDGDPPNFDTLIPTDQTVILVVSGVAAPYFLTGAPGFDSFTLSAPWAGASSVSASYGLQTAFTAGGLPIIEAGDIGAALLVSYGFAQIEANAARYVHVGRSAAQSLGASGAVDWDAVREDTDGWLQAGGGLLVPAGVSLIEIVANFSLGSVGVGDDWAFSLLINGTSYVGVQWVDGAYPARRGVLVTGPIPVTEDDLITTIYTATGAPELQGGLYVGTSLKLRILA